jgi:hypothetical protein
MTSVATRTKQSPNGYFIPLGSLVDSNVILQYTTVGGAGGSYLNGNFVQATWASTGTTLVGKTLSSISGTAKGGLLRDMGKTVVSAGRSFRKIQLITNAVSTGGVNGPAGVTTNPNVDYLTGYIELGSGLNGIQPTGTAAPVAYFPGLM